jgi:hypothetical protein
LVFSVPFFSICHLLLCWDSCFVCILSKWNLGGRCCLVELWLQKDRIHRINF